MRVLDTFGLDDVYLLRTENNSLFTEGTLNLRLIENARSGNMWSALGCIGVIFVFAILLPVVGLGLELWQDSAINRDGVTVEAQIAGCELADGGGTTVIFTYLFLDPEGLLRTYTTSETNAEPNNCADYSEGTPISVRVLPDEPDRVRWRATSDWTQALCVVGGAVFFGVPFLLFQAVSTVRSFRRGKCLDRIEKDGYLKLGKVVESRWKTQKDLEITYHVTTHTGNHITGVATAAQSGERIGKKPPRAGTVIAVAYFNGDCHRLL